MAHFLFQCIRYCLVRTSPLHTPQVVILHFFKRFFLLLNPLFLLPRKHVRWWWSIDFLRRIAFISIYVFTTNQQLKQVRYQPPIFFYFIFCWIYSYKPVIRNSKRDIILLQVSERFRINAVRITEIPLYSTLSTFPISERAFIKNETKTKQRKWLTLFVYHTWNISNYIKSKRFFNVIGYLKESHTVFSW